MRVIAFILVAALIILNWAVTARGDVRHYRINEQNYVILVENDPWQPEGFDEALVLKAARVETVPSIDGKGDDQAWARAKSLTVPLAYGPVNEATLKAVYTDKEVFILVSWPDATKDDLHRPWVWNKDLNSYQEGPQIEDSLLLSFEAGCDWTPSLLSGYVYDFDGWRWLAARSNPLGQAIDSAGHVQDRWISDRGYVKYQSRSNKPFWKMKFTDNRADILTEPWQKLKRDYLFQPIAREVYVSYLPDGYRPPVSIPVFTERVPPPESIKTPHLLGPRPAHADTAPSAIVPQFKPVKLSGDAGEVAAKGLWVNGRWTVEFSRVLETPARTATDTIFNRTTQFSIYIFDHTTRVDQSSESRGLFLQFEPPGKTGK